MSDGVPEGSPVQKHKWGGALFNVPPDGKKHDKGMLRYGGLTCEKTW